MCNQTGGREKELNFAEIQKVRERANAAWRAAAVQCFDFEIHCGAHLVVLLHCSCRLSVLTIDVCCEH